MINVIDIFLVDVPDNSWVFDTGSVAHVCNMMQGLTRTRYIASNEVDLRVGNRARVVVLSIGVMQLHLPSGFIVELNSFYYVPSLSKNIISASCLLMEGYEFSIKGKGCNMMMKDMFYACMPVVNGLFILNLDDRENVYNINAERLKRLKPNNLNPSYLWHCRLGHINEKRMKRLLDEGLTKPGGLEPYAHARLAF